MAQNWLDSADLLACRDLLRGGSRSFFAASLLLPRRVHEPATALYAFCRVADDLIDTGGDPAAALADLRARLDAVYAGQPRPVAADRALAAVVLRHALPNALLPVVTISGVLLGFVLGGSVAVEQAFGVPGLGRALVTAIIERDIIVVQNLVLLYALIFVGVNALVELGQRRQHGANLGSGPAGEGDGH